MMARLGDLFLHIRNGANIKQGLDNTGYPITRIETISNRTVDRNKMGYAGITDLGKYSDFVMQDGDILMSHINSETHLGKTALYEKEDDEIIIHGMNLLSLRPNKDLIISKYAFYYLSSQSFLRQIPNITKKSVNQASFTVSALKELVFPLTSIEEQKKITVALDKVNGSISIRKQQLSKLDELVKSRFIELFGDPILNPKGFAESTVNEYCKMTQGTQIPMSEQISEYQQGYYRYLYIRDLKYDDSNWIYVQDKYDDKKLTEKDLVVVNTGNTAGEIYYGKDGILSNNLFKVSFDTNILNTTYMFVYFSSSEFQSMLWSEMKEGTQPHLGHKIFGSKKLIIPPIDLQNQFATFVEQVDKSKLAIQKSLEKLETPKKALMQKYFG